MILSWSCSVHPPGTPWCHLHPSWLCSLGYDTRLASPSLPYFLSFGCFQLMGSVSGKWKSGRGDGEKCEYFRIYSLQLWAAVGGSDGVLLWLWGCSASWAAPPHLQFPLGSRCSAPAAFSELDWLPQPFFVPWDSITSPLIDPSLKSLQIAELYSFSYQEIDMNNRQNDHLKNGKTFWFRFKIHIQIFNEVYYRFSHLEQHFFLAFSAWS